MRINITARHFKASDNVKGFVEKKVKKLEKYYDGILDCDVLLEYQKMVKVAEISINVFDKHLRVVEKSEDMLKSIELGVDKMERQLKKYKEKRRDHSHAQVEIVNISDESEE